MEEKVCPVCDGKGTVFCSACHGRGVYDVACATCGGSGGYAPTRVWELDVVVGDPCPDCRGTGTDYAACYSCNGRGRKECVACEGTGKVNVDKSSSSIVMSRTLQTEIYRHIENVYPEIGSGYLLGIVTEGQTIAKEIILAPNRARDKRHFFTATPSDWVQLEDEAEDKGLTLVGYFYSSINAPAQPSSFDRAHALPNFSYLCVSIRSGKAVDMLAWKLCFDRSKFELGELVIG